MIHRFDLTVKKELTKERGSEHPTMLSALRGRGADPSHQNTAPRKQDWELSLSLFAAAELTIGAESSPFRFAVPGESFGLTLFLQFSDRCSNPAMP